MRIWTADYYHVTHLKTVRTDRTCEGTLPKSSSLHLQVLAHCQSFIWTLVYLVLKTRECPESLVQSRSCQMRLCYQGRSRLSVRSFVWIFLFQILNILAAAVKSHSWKNCNFLILVFSLAFIAWDWNPDVTLEGGLIGPDAPTHFMMKSSNFREGWGSISINYIRSCFKCWERSRNWSAFGYS